MDNVAVAHEDVYTGAKIARAKNAEELTVALAAIIPSNLSAADVVFVCIGTDRSTGDSLGPLVGMYLRGIGYPHVVGHIDDTTHALNLADRIASLPEGKTVIAIDACLGAVTNVGSMAVIRGSIKPGAGVNKTHLPEVGDYAISATVNVDRGFTALQSTRLSLVMRLAKDITSAIVNVLPVDGVRKVAEVAPQATEKSKQAEGVTA